MASSFPQAREKTMQKPICKSAISTKTARKSLPRYLEFHDVLICCASRAFSSAYAAIEREFEQRSGFRLQKIPPPTPDRREGRLFPPEQS